MQEQPDPQEVAPPGPIPLGAAEDGIPFPVEERPHLGHPEKAILEVPTVLGGISFPGPQQLTIEHEGGAGRQDQVPGVVARP